MPRGSCSASATSMTRALLRKASSLRPLKHLSSWVHTSSLSSAPDAPASGRKDWSTPRRRFIWRPETRSLTMPSPYAWTRTATSKARFCTRRTRSPSTSATRPPVVFSVCCSSSWDKSKRPSSHCGARSLSNRKAPTVGTAWRPPCIMPICSTMRNRRTERHLHSSPISRARSATLPFCSGIGVGPTSRSKPCAIALHVDRPQPHTALRSQRLPTWCGRAASSTKRLDSILRRQSLRRPIVSGKCSTWDWSLPNEAIKSRRARRSNMRCGFARGRYEPHLRTI